MSIANTPDARHPYADPHFTPRAGSLCYLDAQAGVWRTANPHDALYSTVSMAATHYWLEAGRWESIFQEATKCPWCGYRVLEPCDVPPAMLCPQASECRLRGE